MGPIKLVCVSSEGYRDLGRAGTLRVTYEGLKTHI